ncbi:hypothetical protein [Solidesulfovibrio fructosivorans]|uniref:hypothetical protein n=1 Tax=Solidesulfovibrio fructosivorans TaxID=878 RepID=UPI0005C1A573|nr:hypothetical protein [Solidesulfovibrio fructosivorans]
MESERCQIGMALGGLGLNGLSDEGGRLGLEELALSLRFQLLVPSHKLGIARSKLFDPDFLLVESLPEDLYA